MFAGIITSLLEVLFALIGPIAEVISALIVALIEWLTGGGEGGNMSNFF